MSNWWIQLQEYDLFLNAFLASIIISFASAPIGVFLNLKRMTLMGEAIGHSLLPGFALAFLFFGMSYFGLIVGGLFAGVLVLGLMMGMNRFVAIKEDGILTIVYLTFSAFGLLIVLKSGIKIDLSHILVGNILLIDRIWLSILFVSSLLIRVIFNWIKNSLLIIMMDPEYAQFLGIHVQRIKSIFYFLVLWILVLCFYSVGTLLALGLLMIPSLIAKIVTRRIENQITLSFILGILMGVFGIIGSICLDWPTGPSIILSGGILFVFIAIIRTKKMRQLSIFVILFFASTKSNGASLFPVTPKDQILISNPYVKLFLNHLIDDQAKYSIQWLIPEDQSLHSYQIKPSDLKKIKRAKKFTYFSNEIEFNLREQIIKMNPEMESLDLGPSQSEGKNIHFWLDPEFAELILEKLRVVLNQERPDLKSNVDNRFKIAINDLAILKKTTAERFKIYKNRKIILNHNSFYFLKSFIGLDVLSYTMNSNPSDWMQLKRMIKDKTVPILSEHNSLNFLFDSLLKEQNRTYDGELFSEIIPSDIYKDKSYTDVLKINLDTIYNSLSKK